MRTGGTGREPPPPGSGLLRKIIGESKLIFVDQSGSHQSLSEYFRDSDEILIIIKYKDIYQDIHGMFLASQ